jgi:hypothetical protein
MGTFKLIIPGNTPSLKNSKQIFTNKKTGKPFVTSSENHKEWYPKAFEAANNSAFVLKEWNYPLRISFHFIRKTLHTFDYINIAQAILDLLVDTRIIEDDDMIHVIPGDWSYQVNPDAACCVLTIEEASGNNQ